MPSTIIALNGSTPLNKRAARAPYNITSPPEPLVQIQNNVTELSLDTRYQNCTNGFAPLKKGPPELQIRNIFEMHLLLSHWSK